MGGSSHPRGVVLQTKDDALVWKGCSIKRVFDTAVVCTGMLYTNLVQGGLPAYRSNRYSLQLILFREATQLSTSRIVSVIPYAFHTPSLSKMLLTRT